MASIRLPRANDSLFSLADDAVDGAVQYEATLPLKQNTSSAISGDLQMARQKQVLFKAAETLLSNAHDALQIADSNAKAFLAKFKKAMTGAMGDQWRAEYGEAGFAQGSLQMPGTQDDRFAMAYKIPKFLMDHPECEDARMTVQVTTAQAQTIYDVLDTARAAVNLKETAAGEAMNVRDVAVVALRKRLTGLIAELEQTIAEDSPIWYAFGLNAPADPSTPGVPLSGPTLTPGAAGTAYSVWGIGRRSDYYHVWLQIMGTDAAPVRVATVTDRAFTFTGLPSGATVKVSISGVNEAGEGPQTAQAEIVVP